MHEWTETVSVHQGERQLWDLKPTRGKLKGRVIVRTPFITETDKFAKEWSKTSKHDYTTGKIIENRKKRRTLLTGKKTGLVYGKDY